MGKVIRPHGLRGLLRIISYSGSAASFSDVETAWFRLVSGKIHQLNVASIRPHKNAFLMDVDGIGSAHDAEAYRGAEILVSEDSLIREEGTYFWFELLGLDVYVDTGVFLGRVSQIIATGANDIYVVRKGEKEVYIPASTEVIADIDLDHKRITISPMEGLLDLNEI